MGRQKTKEPILKSLFYKIFVIPVIYYLIITPVSLILRLSKRPFLELKLSKKDSVWKIKNNKINYQRLD